MTALWLGVACSATACLLVLAAGIAGAHESRGDRPHPDRQKGPTR